MLSMYEITFVSHALCDYLRPIAGEEAVHVMDQDNQAGEWLCAITWGLALCEDLHIPLPPLFGQKILALEGLSDSEVHALKQQLERIPAWMKMAS